MGGGDGAATLLGGDGGAIAVVDGATGRAITYGELRVRASDAGAVLAAQAGEGGLAFVFARNDVDTIAAIAGALEAGVPFALLDARLPAARAAALVERYAPRVLAGAVPAGVAIDPAAAARAVAPHPSLAALLTTSGATGSPKLVRLTRDAIVANARAIAAGLAIGPGEVAPTSLPVHYAYGLSIVTSHLAAGATLLVTDAGLTDEAFWRACREHGATSLAGVPYSYDMLRRIDLDRVAPPSLRTLTQAGGALAPALVDRFAAIARARGGGLYVMYGQTEATARIAIATPDDVAARPGSVGRAIAGGAIAIEADGAALPAGATGEVVFRGPSVMLGYATSRDDLARGDGQHGVLHTGDLGHLDAGGHLWITGRSKRIAKVFGLRLNLDELEVALRDRPDGPAAALAGKDDRLIVRVEGDDAAAAAVKAALVAITGLHPSGVIATAVPSLPRLASGKIDYSAL